MNFWLGSRDRKLLASCSSALDLSVGRHVLIGLSARASGRRAAMPSARDFVHITDDDEPASASSSLSSSRCKRLDIALLPCTGCPWSVSQIRFTADDILLEDGWSVLPTLFKSSPALACVGNISLLFCSEYIEFLLLLLLLMCLAATDAPHLITRYARPRIARNLYYRDLFELVRHFANAFSSPSDKREYESVSRKNSFDFILMQSH